VEIQRLDWPQVELDGYRLVVRKSKSAAGTGRRPPIAEPLRPILLGEHMRQGRRGTGSVSAVSVMAGYTLRELMEYMGHSSLQATER
jgi:integrase